MRIFDDFFIKGEKQAFKRIGRSVAITLVVSFVGLGFSTGIRKNLEMKMNDPFINNIEKSLVAFNREQRIEKYDEIKNDTLLVNGLNINKVDLVGEVSIPINVLNDSVPGYYYSRFYQNNYILLDKILENKNIVSGKDSISSDEYGIIVTEDLLKKLGYNAGNYPEFISVQKKVNLNNGKHTEVSYNFPISTIVKRLPGENSYTATQCFVSNYMIGNFYESLLGATHNRTLGAYQRFDPRVKNEFTIYIPEKNKAKISAIADSIKMALLNCKEFKAMRFKVKSFKVDTTYYTYRGGGSCIQYKMEKPTGDLFKPVAYPNYFDCQRMFSMIKDDTYLDKYKSRVTLLKNEDLLVNSEYVDKKIEGHILSLTFNNLDAAEFIAPMFKERHELDLEMTKIENAKNYKKVTWLSNISNAIILIISIIAVTLTTFFLLDNYLNSVKTSLGTLMAFGVKGIRKIYLRIIFEYLLWAWGGATLVVFLAQIITRLLFPDEILLHLWSIYYMLLLIVMIALPFVIFSYLNKRLFLRTPGDLIYERDYIGNSFIRSLFKRSSREEKK